MKQMGLWCGRTGWKIWNNGTFFIFYLYFRAIIQNVNSHYTELLLNRIMWTYGLFNVYFSVCTYAHIANKFALLFENSLLVCRKKSFIFFLFFFVSFVNIGNLDYYKQIFSVQIWRSLKLLINDFSSRMWNKN